MVTTLPVVDLPANAITPAGHFISERCLGHDSKVLIRRFRGIPAMPGEPRESERGGTRRYRRFAKARWLEVVVKLLRRELRV